MNDVGQTVPSSLEALDLDLIPIYCCCRWIIASEDIVLLGTLARLLPDKSILIGQQRTDINRKSSTSVVASLFSLIK
jgi:hypothetical protein